MKETSVLQAFIPSDTGHCLWCSGIKAQLERVEREWEETEERQPAQTILWESFTMNQKQTVSAAD